ncbi:hypothetical protein CEE95_15080, partial [Lactobacillus crispatus]
MPDLGTTKLDHVLSYICKGFEKMLEFKLQHFFKSLTDITQYMIKLSSAQIWHNALLCVPTYAILLYTS